MWAWGSVEWKVRRPGPLPLHICHLPSLVPGYLSRGRFENVLPHGPSCIPRVFVPHEPHAHCNKSSIVVVLILPIHHRGAFSGNWNRPPPFPPFFGFLNLRSWGAVLFPPTPWGRQQQPGSSGGLAGSFMRLPGFPVSPPFPCLWCAVNNLFQPQFMSRICIQNAHETGIQMCQKNRLDHF